MKKVIDYPSWHDDVRRDRKAGATCPQLADKYGVSASRISQISTANWQAYFVQFRTAKEDRDLGKALAALARGEFEFRRVDELSPAVREQQIKQQKRPAPKPYQEEDPMSKPREFQALKEIHEGKILKGALIRCSKCTTSEKYFNFQGSVSTEHLPKEFSRRGWLVGKNERGDLCPSCLGKLRGPKPQSHIPQRVSQHAPQKEVIMQVPMPSLIPATVAPPITPVVASIPATSTATLTEVRAEVKDRVMDRTDRRLVFSRLNDLYQDEKSGYSGDWTDAKVAFDLGVPVEWVAEVRDSDFGPELNKEMLSRKFSDLVALGEKVERHIVLVDKKIEQMQALDTKLTDIKESIDLTVTRFDELVASLITEDKRIEGVINTFNADVDAFRKSFKELQAAPSNA